MPFVTIIDEDPDNREWWVEARIVEEGFIEIGGVAVAKSRGAAMRKAVKALRKEADRLEKLERKEAMAAKEGE